MDNHFVNLKYTINSCRQKWKVKLMRQFCTDTTLGPRSSSHNNIRKSINNQHDHSYSEYLCNNLYLGILKKVKIRLTGSHIIELYSLAYNIYYIVKYSKIILHLLC